MCIAYLIGILANQIQGSEKLYNIYRVVLQDAVAKFTVYFFSLNQTNLVLAEY